MVFVFSSAALSQKISIKAVKSASTELTTIKLAGTATDTSETFKLMWEHGVDLYGFDPSGEDSVDIDVEFQTCNDPDNSTVQALFSGWHTVWTATLSSDSTIFSDAITDTTGRNKYGRFIWTGSDDNSKGSVASPESTYVRTIFKTAKDK
jgi:hypothetical protein